MTTALQKEPRREGTVRRVEPSRATPVYSPQVDIVETADELTLIADIPGARSDGIDIQYERGELTIRARVEQRQSEEHRYAIREYGVGDYQRAFRLGESIDNAKIAAEMSNGVLTVHLPKLERVKPRKIAVKTA